MDEETDEQLIAGWRGGDRRCGDALARRYHEELMGFFDRRVDSSAARDLVQEVLLRAVVRVDTFRGESSFRHYTYSIVRLVLADYFRKFRRSREESVGSCQ